MTTIQLLLLSSNLDKDQSAQLDDLKSTLSDRLSKTGGSVEMISLGSEPFEDPGYSLLFEKKWSHLLIAPGDDHHRPSEWWWMIEKISTIFPALRAAIVLEDFSADPKPATFTMTLAEQSAVPIFAARAADGDLSEQILELILRPDLKSAAPAERFNKTLAPAIGLSRPEPKSVQFLAELRAAAKVDYVHVAAADTAALQRSQAEADGEDIVLSKEIAVSIEDEVRDEDELSQEGPDLSAPAPPSTRFERRVPPRSSSSDVSDARDVAVRRTQAARQREEARRRQRGATTLTVAATLGAISLLAVVSALYGQTLLAAIAPIFKPLLKLFGSGLPPVPAALPMNGEIVPGSPDEVELAAFAPSACEAGETILVQALLHLPADRQAAAVMAAAADPAAICKTSQTLSIALERGQSVDLELEAPGCQIDEVRQSATWRGEPVAVQFFVTVPNDRTKPVPVRIVVVRFGVPVGTVRFMIPVRAGAKDSMLQVQGDEAKRFARAFLSYASPDRVAVLGYAEALSMVGIKVFQDVLSLDPGDRWEKRLYEEIERSDLFVLFWSTAASQSKWVIAEAGYALRSANESPTQDPTIRPFPLEGPPIPTIPEDLKAIHFNDKFRYMILGATVEAEARRQRQTAH